MVTADRSKGLIMIALLVAARDILIAVVLSWMGFGQSTADIEEPTDAQKKPSLTLTISAH